MSRLDDAAPLQLASHAQRQLGSCCTDDCAWAKDGYCDDGGPGSEFAGCAIGTDCKDCCADSECKETRCQQEIVLHPKSDDYDFEKKRLRRNEFIPVEPVGGNRIVDVAVPEIADPVKVAMVYALAVDGANGCASLTDESYDTIVGADQCRTVPRP